MADLVSGAVGTLQGSLSGLTSKAMSLIDKVLPPERRASLMATIQKFAAERPGVASFLLSHLALSGLPIAIFIIFTITVAIFALLVAIIVALLAAVLFIVVMAGFALAILFPVLLFTTFVAVAVWIWGWGAWYLLKWFNQKEIPGMHTGLKEGGIEEVKSFLGDIGAKQAAGPYAAHDDEKEAAGQNGTKEQGETRRTQESETSQNNGEKPSGSGAKTEAKSSGADAANPNDSKKLAKRHPGHKLEAPREASSRDDGAAAKDSRSSSTSKPAESGTGQAKSTPTKTAQNSVPPTL